MRAPPMLPPPKSLRKQAERLLSTTRRQVTRMPAEDVQKLVHELQVYQIELEMQNDDLRQAQLEMEVARDRYVELYNFAPIALLTMTDEGEILEVNQAACELLGLDPDQILHQKITHFILAASQDAFYLLCHRVFRTRRWQSADLELRNSQNQRLLVHVNAMRETTNRGKKIQLSLTDLTARQQMEDWLKASLKETLDIKTAMDEHAIVVITTPQGKITYVNDKFCTLSGYSRKELIGQDQSLMNSRFHSKAFMRDLWATIGQGEVWKGEIKNRAKNGNFYWVDTTIVPFFDEAGKIRQYVSIRSDITSRKLAEEKVQEIADRLALATHVGGVGIWEYDVVHKRVIWDDQMHLLYSTTPKRFGGNLQSWNTLVHPADRRRGTGEIQLALRGQKNFDTEFRILWPDGSIHHIRAIARVQRDAAGKPLRMIGTNWDITERARFEESLRHSEQKLSSFFNDAPIGLEWLSASGVVLRANQAQLKLFGYVPGEYLGHLFLEFCPDPGRGRELLRRLMARETVRNFSMTRQAKDGTIHQTLVDAISFWEGDRFLHSAIFLRDISDRVQLEKEILQVGERERQRMSRDLHDGMGQLLAGTAYLTEAVRKKLVGKALPESRELGRIQEVIKEAIGQARSLARGLRPVDPEPNGLMLALEALAKQTSHLFHIRCHFNCPRPVLISDNTVATHLFWIAQESVTNAIKHGKSKRIEILLNRTPKRINLAVKNNGLSLITQPGINPGMGLRIMRYRAGIIGGSLAIQTEADGGVTIVCTVHQKRTQEYAPPAARKKSSG